MNYILGGALGALIIFFILRSGAPAESNMTPQELRARIATEPGLQLIDVRTAGEFAAEHLKGAKNIPVDALASRLGELAKDKPIALYCRSGNRSGTALRLLQEQGFTQVKHLPGGILAWQSEGLPL